MITCGVNVGIRKPIQLTCILKLKRDLAMNNHPELGVSNSNTPMIHKTTTMVIVYIVAGNG